MKKEGTFGIGAVLVVAAALGLSLQTGSKPEATSRSGQASLAKRPEGAKKQTSDPDLRPGCRSIADELEEFLEVQLSSLPDYCYASTHRPVSLPQTAVQPMLKFVIALLPDPVHTHLAPLFDQFTTAVQEGAQDEQYDFDSSSLPWESNDESYALLADQKIANREKDWREKQPGIILFRKKLSNKTGSEGHSTPDSADSYLSGLVVFVVGEEATQGIHQEQFENALAWMDVLAANGRNGRVGILGPTFSGSLPSLQRVLLKHNYSIQPGVNKSHEDEDLTIYSGSVSSEDAAQSFRDKLGTNTSFHSFIDSDDERLGRFCAYMKLEQPGFPTSKLAVISEDETAYGGAGMVGMSSDDETQGKLQNGAEANCFKNAVQFFYPRDISALRGAYQTRSMFDSTAPSQPSDTQKRNLPTDLADPAGRVHDSIRSFGGNQTPLSQEASLLNIVAALREFHTRYILLRSSNTLDQLFLANFLRRSYPNGRILILGSDLLFMRERGATGLSGTMLLSNYPLFPLVRDWTENRSLPAADRLFSSDTTEGTYIAMRLLLNAKSMGQGQSCRVQETGQKSVFVPPVACAAKSPIPDYAPPQWMLADNSDGKKKDENCLYAGPATWLTVIGVNRIWPVAAIDEPIDTQRQAQPTYVSCRSLDPDFRADSPPDADQSGQIPTMPLGMKIFLLGLAAFSTFHAWCCWAGSYTSKPAFRAHFASPGDGQHSALIFTGCMWVVLLGITAGWGSGAFSDIPSDLDYRKKALWFMIFILLMAWLAVLFYTRASWKLARQERDLVESAKRKAILRGWRLSLLLVVSAICFYSFSIYPVEGTLSPSIQRILSPNNIVFGHWRAMHLASGVSPLLPLLLILAGLYGWFWISLHGLALLGPDRPCLPPQETLTMVLDGKPKNYLRMFSQEDGANQAEQASKPFDWRTVLIMAVLLVFFCFAVLLLGGGIPIRGMGPDSYSATMLFWLVLSYSLMLAEACRLCLVWERLRRLLTFLDRLPLRRTLAELHGFSWGGVWKMSGNVLEVRYKVISRQLECMNHTIASLCEFANNSPDTKDVDSAQDALKSMEAMQQSNLISKLLECMKQAIAPFRESSIQPQDSKEPRTASVGLATLKEMQRKGRLFADWYSESFTQSRAGNLQPFYEFQQSVAVAAGTILSQVLVPSWSKEKDSLILAPPADLDSTDGKKQPPPPLAKEPHVRNAEEFVCLAFLGFVQNILGRLRTIAMSVAVLYIASTVALSTYPFDPRQSVSIVLIILFVVVGGIIVKVYAEMHRDSTLSHITNTKPGELGAEFWIKILGFGFAPLVGLLTRIIPGLGDFLFSWLQPGISALK
jgi:hypothetical protein